MNDQQFVHFSIMPTEVYLGQNEDGGACYTRAYFLEACTPYGKIYQQPIIDMDKTQEELQKEADSYNAQKLGASEFKNAFPNWLLTGKVNSVDSYSRRQMEKLKLKLKLKLEPFFEKSPSF